MAVITGVLGMGRRLAESRMTDTCKITRPGGKTWNESSGAYDQIPITVYEGKCRIRQPSSQAKDVEAGSQLLVMTSTEVHLPIWAVGVKPGDTVEITRSETRSDQTNRSFTVEAPFDGSQTTALRYRVVVTDERR